MGVGGMIHPPNYHFTDLTLEKIIEVACPDRIKDTQPILEQRCYFRQQQLHIHEWLLGGIEQVVLIYGWTILLLTTCNMLPNLGSFSWPVPCD